MKRRRVRWAAKVLLSVTRKWARRPVLWVKWTGQKKMTEQEWEQK